MYSQGSLIIFGDVNPGS